MTSLSGAKFKNLLPMTLENLFCGLLEGGSNPQDLAQLVILAFFFLM